MRIVGGRFRGATIAAPEGGATRPTSDRVRESVFNILTHGVDDFTLEGARALDLFAGSGALGLEALSRGAKFCLFVEESAGARGVVRENIEALKLTGQTKVFRRDATNLGEAGTLAPFDLAFLDPPYGQGLGDSALASLAGGGWLAPGAVVVLEERRGVAVAAPAACAHFETREYGDTQVLFYRVS